MGLRRAQLRGCSLIPPEELGLRHGLGNLPWSLGGATAAATDRRPSTLPAGATRAPGPTQGGWKEQGKERPSSPTPRGASSPVQTSGGSREKGPHSSYSRTHHAPVKGIPSTRRIRPRTGLLSELDRSLTSGLF